MNEWENYLSHLKCLDCGGNLDVSAVSKVYKQYEHVNRELVCPACSRSYPVFQDIPVIFKDISRMEMLIDPKKYKEQLTSAKEKANKAKDAIGSELDSFKEKNELIGSLSWEILFWEQWKETDYGFLEYDERKIENFLQQSSDGELLLPFLDAVFAYIGRISKTRILNIGAGRDFLLGKLLQRGVSVIEQDVVLESLLYLKKRGASFCICCDARSLPFEDDTFGGATCFGALHHIWPIEEPLLEIIRITSGTIAICEPSSLSLTKAGFALPGFMKKKLKQWYSPESSHSPYEKSVNPYRVKKIAESSQAEVIKLSFSSSSSVWVANEYMRLLKSFHLGLIKIFPFLSSAFTIIIRKNYSR